MKTEHCAACLQPAAASPCGLDCSRALEARANFQRANEVAAEKPVRVLFRIDRRDDPRDVYALFPDLPADRAGRYCTCYAHVGQHSSADYAGCVARSRPARPEEFASLARELTGRGYTLRLARRR